MERPGLGIGVVKISTGECLFFCFPINTFHRYNGNIFNRNEQNELSIKVQLIFSRINRKGGMAMATNIVWLSKNRLWEILVEGESLMVRNTKDGSRYTVDIDKKQKAHLWSTSIKSQNVPAYVISRTERVYRDLRQPGQLI